MYGFRKIREKLESLLWIVYNPSWRVKFFSGKVEREVSILETWLAILLIIIALVAGVALGFFLARQSMMKYLKENPPINEQMIRVMMAQMGRKPSEKQVRQMMAQLNKIQEKQK